MSEVFGSLISHQYLNFISIIIAIFSILAAYVFYRKSQKKIWLAYNKFQTNIIDKEKNEFENLTITHEGKKLEAFNTSDIFFRNLGNVSIRESDIATSSLLRLEAKQDSSILEVRTAYQKILRIRFL